MYLKICITVKLWNLGSGNKDLLLLLLLLYIYIYIYIYGQESDQAGIQDKKIVGG